MIGKVLESSALEITTRMEFEDFEKNKDNFRDRNGTYDVTNDKYGSLCSN